jgi:hypothetical protein
MKFVMKHLAKLVVALRGILEGLLIVLNQPESPPQMLEFVLIPK